jgi:hypothetical protein
MPDTVLPVSRSVEAMVIYRVKRGKCSVEVWQWLRKNWPHPGTNDAGHDLSVKQF